MDNQKSSKTLVSVSGYNYTGSSAVVDLLLEYDHVSVVEPELAFVYLPDGLMDLEYSINRAPTYFNGDVAIHRYWDLCKRCGFPRAFRKKFLQYTKEFLAKLTEVEWKGKSSFDITRLKGLPYFWWRIQWLYCSAVFHFFKKAPHLNERTMVLAHRQKDFSEAVDTYLNQVADLVAPDCDIAVFNQFFSAFQPDETMHNMKNAKTIVVDRDPRDVYVLGHVCRGTGSFPSGDVKAFVTWYKKCWDNRQKENSDRTLILNFEDVVMDYDNVVKQIEEFLGLGEHVRPKQRFKPEMSINNTQLKWRVPELSDDIAYIERELAEYLYPFKEERKVTEGFF